MAAQICVARIGKTEAGRSLGLSGQPYYPTWLTPGQWEALLKTRWMVPREQHLRLPHAHQCTCLTPGHTQEHYIHADFNSKRKWNFEMRRGSSFLGTFSEKKNNNNIWLHELHCPHLGEMGLEEKTNQALSPVLIWFYGFFFFYFPSSFSVTFCYSSFKAVPTDCKPFPIGSF